MSDTSLSLVKEYTNKLRNPPLPFLGRDMWGEIAGFIESPADWLQFRACCSLFRSVATKKDFGVEGLRCVRRLDGHTDCLRSVIDFEGMLISASDDKTIKFWDVKSGKCLTLIEHSDWVLCLTVFDSKLISGSMDKTIKIWNSKGECLKTLRGHSDFVLCLSPAFDNEFLVSGSSDHTIKLWSKEGDCVKTLVGHSDSVWSLTSFHDFLISGSRFGTIKWWNREGNCVKTLEAHLSMISNLLIVDNKLLSGSWDNTVKIWNPNEDWKCIRTIDFRRGLEGLMHIISYAGFLCLQFTNGMFEFWDFDFENQRHFQTDPVSLLVECKGNLITNSDAFEIKIWDSVFPCCFPVQTAANTVPAGRKRKR